ncbi:MAG: hypothetical protein M1817_001151 [Caeruleum heppii]|nr:MAG: hypothetical protein M1817_001151 [Caeruleum heppii]
MQLGMLMFVVSNVLGSSIQITTLPLPVLSTLQASGLVFNSICATLILGESFTRWSLIGTILVSTGALLIAAFGAMKEPAHSLDQLLDLLGRRPFILWMISQALLVVAIIVGAKLLRYLGPKATHGARIRLLRGMAYGAVSGVLSAHSLLAAKSAVELLVRTVVDRVNQFDRWQSWMSLVGLLTLALSQLYYLHRGLKLVSTSILYPFVFCIYNIIAILDGLIYFRQASKLSLAHALLIALGTVILLSGVFALSWRLNDAEAAAQQPPVSQSALAPGLGLLEQTESDDGQGSSDDSDERRPLVLPRTRTSVSLFSSRLRSPTTTRFDEILSATQPRRRGITEAAEIWGELEDDPDPHSHLPSRSTTSSPLSLHHRRRSSLITPSRHLPRIADENGPHGPAPDESSALLPRRSTIASHHRRRASQPSRSATWVTARSRRSSRNIAQTERRDSGRWWEFGWPGWISRRGEDGKKGSGDDGDVERGCGRGSDGV